MCLLFLRASGREQGTASVCCQADGGVIVVPMLEGCYEGGFGCLSLERDPRADHARERRAMSER